MVYFSTKTIKGKNYLYALKSIRMPDGKIVKLSKRVDEKVENEELKKIFAEKGAASFVGFAKKNYLPLQLRDLNALEKIEEAKIDYGKILSKLSESQLNDLFDRFTVNFTYESNAIEGNSLTLKDVAIVVHENIAVKGKDLREIYETRNSRKVMDLILKGGFKVKKEDVLKMHFLLVVDMDIPKGYKQVPNYIHGRQVITAVPEQVEAEMDELFNWFEENQTKRHPLQLAALFHGKFERIHPFEDGNGRVGRFLINVILTNAGYPPLIIRKTQRLSYFNALEDFDNGRSKMLEEFLFQRLVETHKKFFQVYVKYLK